MCPVSSPTAEPYLVHALGLEDTCVDGHVVHAGDEPGHVPLLLAVLTKLLLPLLGAIHVSLHPQAMLFATYTQGETKEKERKRVRILVLAEYQHLYRKTESEIETWEVQYKWN